jgi:formylglycine-generating enzyme
MLPKGAFVRSRILGAAALIVQIAGCGSATLHSSDGGAGKSGTGGSNGSGGSAGGAAGTNSRDGSTSNADSGTKDAAGEGPTVMFGPSCSGLPATCGPNGSENCCASRAVPGGTFNRLNNASYPAVVSDFVLDRFEVTVGRFRKFVLAGKGTSASPPVQGQGKNPNNPSDAGWITDYNAVLPADATALATALTSCGGGFSTWTSAAGSGEDLPIECVPWLDAQAFCIWDGGRLPTLAEWNYAAAGGGGADGQRYYPWSVPSTSMTIDDTYCVSSASSVTAPQTVGSRSPKGDARWGHADMAGNVWEWVNDADPGTFLPCDNCSTAVQPHAEGFFFGGSWSQTPFQEQTLTFDGGSSVPGFRCAR